jgi:UDP-glucose 4,6-dehydratase
MMLAHVLCLHMQFVKGNICSSDLVTYVLREEQIDTIIHFAAQTHVDNSFGNSFTFTHNNIMGTHVLLESAKEIGTIKRFIHVSTDEVYGEGEVSPACNLSLVLLLFQC